VPQAGPALLHFMAWYSKGQVPNSYLIEHGQINSGGNKSVANCSCQNGALITKL